MENKINEKKGAPVKIFTFNEAYIPPVYKFEKKGDYHFISWGADNLYPVYLLELYNNYGSPLNKAIINKKTKLSAGLQLITFQLPAFNSSSFQLFPAVFVTIKYKFIIYILY